MLPCHSASYSITMTILVKQQADVQQVLQQEVQTHHRKDALAVRFISRSNWFCTSSLTPNWAIVRRGSFLKSLATSLSSLTFFWRDFTIFLISPLLG